MTSDIRICGQRLRSLYPRTLAQIAGTVWWEHKRFRHSLVAARRPAFRRCSPVVRHEAAHHATLHVEVVAESGVCHPVYRYDERPETRKYSGWSGRRDSNPRRPAWKAGILPSIRCSAAASVTATVVSSAVMQVPLLLANCYKYRRATTRFRCSSTMCYRALDSDVWQTALSRPRHMESGVVIAVGSPSPVTGRGSAQRRRRGSGVRLFPIRHVETPRLFPTAGAWPEAISRL